MIWSESMQPSCGVARWLCPVQTSHQPNVQPVPFTMCADAYPVTKTDKP